MNNISVSTLVRYLKNKLDSDTNLQGVLVSGELSNFHMHNSGHLYFTLKDEKSAISCVMFSSKASHLKFMPKNGDKVLVNANTSLFETSGQLQLYVNTMKLDGVGDLYTQYEELKNKLANEGIFSDEHKKDFTIEYPNNVAVLVGDKSAAMSDIKTQFNRRWPLAKVDYYPVLVQGNDAPKDIVINLLKVDKLNYDYIILARGGGSFEDLFCFNDENLVRTIYNLDTFIITGVGHEQDYTLVDFVSDLRAPTPTASVELTTPNINDVLNEIESNEEYIKQILSNKLDEFNDDLDKLSNNKYLINPKLLIDKVTLKLDYYDSKLLSYSKTIDNIESNINKYIDLLNLYIKRKLNNYKIEVDKYVSLLKALGVDNTLKRGYSLVYKENTLINNNDGINVGDTLNIKLYKGTIKTKVEGKDNG